MDPAVSLQAKDRIERILNKSPELLTLIGDGRIEEVLSYTPRHQRKPFVCRFTYRGLMQNILDITVAESNRNINYKYNPTNASIEFGFRNYGFVIKSNPEAIEDMHLWRTARNYAKSVNSTLKN